MRCLFEGGAYLKIVPDKFTFSIYIYIYIRRYTFYQFLWTDTKLIVNLELREKFMRWKKPESFITRVKLSAVRVTSFVVVEQLTIYNVQLILMSLSPHRGCSAYSRAVLINFFVPDAALIRGQRLFKGGAYSSKYSMQVYSFSADTNCTGFGSPISELYRMLRQS